MLPTITTRTDAPALARRFTVAAVALLGGIMVACADSDEEHNRHLERAHSHYKQGDLERARVDLLNALRLQPRSVDASLLGARVAMDMSEWRRAAQLFQNALEDAPRNVDALIGLARIYVLAGQPEDALALTERALAQTPESPQALTTHASALARNGANASAMVHVNTALRLAPENEEAIALLAYLLERSGQPDAALDSLRKGLEQAPNSERLIETLAELALALNRLDVAVDAQRRLIALDPRDRDAQYQLARLLLRGGQYADAQRSLRRYLAIHPDDITARLFLTEATHRSGARAEAEASLAQFLSERDDVPELRLLLANLVERRGDTDAALAAYRASIVAQGDSVIALTARNNVARILIGRGDLDGARELLADVLARNAGDVEALTLSGYLHLRRGDPRRAAADLRAARDGGGEGFVTSLLAQALWSAGERDAAVGELKEHPDAPQADVLLTRYLLDEGNVEAARSRIAALLRDDPLSLAANEMNVELGIIDGDLERAMLSARVIIDGFATGPLGYHLAARVERARGHTRSAKQHAVRALELAPEAVEPLELLLDMLLADGQTDDARRALDDVLLRRPTHAIALWWRGRIALIESAPDDAEVFFRRATEATPAWSRPWQWWARLATAQQRHADAQAILDRGIEATDHAPELVARRAELDAATGDMNAAIERYRILLHRDPQAPRVVNNLAMLLLEAERGVPDLVEARTLVASLDAGDDPRLLDTIGQVMARTCAWPRAEEAWRSALDADPHNAAYQLRLARTLIAQARSAEARALVAGLAGDKLSSAQRDELARLTELTGRTTDMPCVQLSHDISNPVLTENTT